LGILGGLKSILGAWHSLQDLVWRVRHYWEGGKRRGLVPLLSPEMRGCAKADGAALMNIRRAGDTQCVRLLFPPTWREGNH